MESKTDKLNVKERIKGKEFILIYERPLDIQRQEGFVKRTSNFALKDILLIPTGRPGWGNYYGEKLQLHEMGIKVADIFLNVDKFEDHLKSYFKGAKELDELFEEIEKGNLDDKKISEIYKRRFKVMSSEFADSILAPLVLESHVVPKLKEMLKEDFGKQDIEEEWKIVNSPTDLIEIQKLQIKISELYLKDKLKENLSKLREENTWMTVYRLGEEGAGEEYFESLVMGGNKQEVEDKVDKLKKDIKGNKEKLENLLKKIKSSRLKHLIKSLNFYLTFRTDRADYLRKIAYYSDILFKQVFSVLKNENPEWEYLEFINLTYDEVVDYLENKNLPDLNEIKKRLDDKNILYYADGEFNLITNEEDKELVKKAANVKELGDISEFSGNIANKGKASGKVKIVITNNDLSKVNEGDVLVSIMTFPDFIPAMRKASAFVTDDGGITCHAAIVSREMNKPCIVGTKIATRILEDNMNVEVDAEKGIVKILDKK